MGARHRLSAAFVRSAPEGKYCDGDGLWLVKRADGGAQWVLRLTVHGRRREMGLGKLQDVSLRTARDLADAARRAVADGRDPIHERAERNCAALRSDTSLAAIASAAFEARKAELKGEGQAGRWFSPLKIYVLPKLGRVPVEKVTQRDIVEVLQPLWHNKADTAEKALNRLGIILKHAAALGIDVDLQATTKAKALLGKSRHKIVNVPSVRWQDVPQFYASLFELTITNLSLRLLILTGVRSGPLRHLRLDDVVDGVWTIPAEQMKGRVGKTDSFRVPLSEEALRVIELARPFARDGYLFPSMRTGVISDATMSRMMERRGMSERPHGFRASLRTWLAEATDAPYEVAETVLSHVVGSSSARPYHRTDYLEQRSVLMQRWAKYVTQEGLNTSNAGDEIIG
jgi:integrase